MRVLTTLLAYLGSAVLFCCAAGTVHADEAAAPKGTLVIIGGGLRGDNAEVWQRIVQLAGGKGARIAVFPSASAYPEQAGLSIIKRLDQYGAKAFLVPVAVKLADSDFRKAADDARLADSVRHAGGVFFAGGDQARITRALLREDGQRSATLEAVWEVYRRGGVIAGTSAGAAIMSSTMFNEPKTVLATLKQGVTEGREIAPGLGFIGEDVFVDQHLLVRGRFARMIPAMLKKGYQIGLGVDENTAMVIDSRREVEIVGYTGALLIDLARATTDEAAAEFNVKNVVISYLDHGDKYNLATRRYTPAPDKAAGKLDPARPYSKMPVFSGDILGSNAVVQLMEKLIDNSQEEALGLALSAPDEASPDLGFEFKFTKTADSVGYQSPMAEAYSIYNLRLDIRPIHLQLPLYQYK
ncbi:cyanophycinase [Rugamonas apoptosis]|uniref:Cyanophycinase n=1 Tax=Rugamonas apoptosis TaxID=2758570 RepID=A0A7W2IL76_9BURK|nr:cyanophycinase [Rugamonas apoptosis]MBA5688187.1 cyanophycinase [Rugamonas apoptosis]